MFPLLFTSCLAICILWLYRRLTMNRGKLEHLSIPVVKPGFLLGSQPLMLHRVRLQELFLDNFLKMNTKTYGRYEGITPIITTIEPSLIKAVTVKHFDDFSEIFDFPIADDQMTLDVAGGELWRCLRKNLSPTFTSGKLKQMLRPMHVVSTNMIDHLKTLLKHDNNAIVDIKRVFQSMALDAIGRCGFGIELDSYDPNNRVVKEAGKIALSFDVSNFRENFFLQLMAHLPFLQNVFGTIVPSQYKEIHKMTKDILASTRLEKSSMKVNFISRLIDLIDRVQIDPHQEDLRLLNEDILVSQGVIFFFAGLETVSNQLSTLAYELAIHPEIQQRVYQEIVETVPADGEVDVEALDKLEYTNAVINENLRMNPAAIMQLRLCTKDCEIEPGMLIKKGTRLEFPIWASHHHPDMFEEPEEFRPQRFLKETHQAFTFRPFGSGLRLCIGQRFAMVEMKVSLALLLLHFELRAVEETKLEFNNGALFVLSFPHMKVKVVPRSKDAL